MSLPQSGAKFMGINLPNHWTRLNYVKKNPSIEGTEDISAVKYLFEEICQSLSLMITLRQCC